MSSAMVSISARRLPVLAAGALVVCLGAGLAGCAPRPAPPQVADIPPPAAGSAYVLGPGDSISVFVYGSPALSSDLPIRPDGRVSVPLVPDIQAAGKTPTELAADIAGKLKEYVQDPNVTVMVRSFVGPFDRQIRVIGEAVEPQALAYREHMTVLDVMIATKGLTKYAAGNRAIIVRGSGAQRETVHVRLDDLMKNGEIDQNVEMRPGDTLIVPQTWF